jgi:large subunit ribosomal protein L21e
MTHCYGYRRRTRSKFAKGFKQHGAIKISKYLTNFKIGDHVDIKVDGAIHKGMPFKFYHGRTGTIFNVNPRSVGVIIRKQVRSRYIEKRIHVRIEHVRKSNVRENFVKRVQENDKKKRLRPTRLERKSPPRDNPPDPEMPTSLSPLRSNSNNPRLSERCSERGGYPACIVVYYLNIITIKNK